MREEARIVGPFTFRQLLYLSAGIGISYLAWKQLPTNISLIIVVPVIAGTFVLVYKNAGKVIDIEHLDEYLAEKRSTLPPEDYRKWLKEKIAEISSQIEMSKERGLPPDDKLNLVLDKYRAVLSTTQGQY